jgi:hypothetical protein
MTKWVIAAIGFALLTALSVAGCLSSLDSVDRLGVHFLASPSVRHGVTTADRVGVMGFAAFMSGLGCLASLAAAIRSRRDIPKLGAENADPGAWRCANCGEENPSNFGECWKCQRVRASGEHELECSI